MSRSSSASVVPAARAASMSSPLASTIAGACARRAAAMASSAPLRSSVVA